MKLIPVQYYGFTAMDRRFSSPMLPWIVSEIRKRDHFEKISVGIEDGYLQAYDADFELQFSHKVCHITRFTQADFDPCTFLYLLRDDADKLLYCYLFHAIKSSDVSDLYQQMKDQSHVNPSPSRSLSSAANLTSLCVDISPSSSNFFEVLYIGKIKVWHRKVPDTFIDDALEKFKAHDLDKRRRNLNRLHSENSLRRGSIEEGELLNQQKCSSDNICIAKNERKRHSSETITGSPQLYQDSNLSSSVTEGPGFTPLIRSSSVLTNLSSTSSLIIDQRIPEGIENISNIEEDKENEEDENENEDEENNNNNSKKEKTQSIPININNVNNSGAQRGRSNSVQDQALLSQHTSSFLSQNQSETEENDENSELKNTFRQHQHHYQQNIRNFNNENSSNDEHNRTMVLQIDRTDLRLISPDRKVILLHKHHKDVTTCVQGIVNSEHFGFICREGNNINTFIGYVFKCESNSVASEAVGAISQAFNNADLALKSINSASIKASSSITAHPHQVTSCEHCPMVFFHKLCVEIEPLSSDRKIQAAIFRKLDQLEEEEQNQILMKFRGAAEEGLESIREQNEFLMMLLRAHCEMKQNRHIHDTVENRSEFLNQYLGGSNTIFMKAKRSLSNSFDHLLKRKNTKDELTLPINNNLNLNHQNRDNEDLNSSSDMRSRASTIGSVNDINKNLNLIAQSQQKKANSVSPDRDRERERSLNLLEKEKCSSNPKSPMMDIFLKVGSNNAKDDFSEDNSKNKNKSNNENGSWRQVIFKRVVTPKTLKETQAEAEEEAQQLSSSSNKIVIKRTSDELKLLWKKSIHQAILLIRMEKENAKLRARQEETAVKRIKLEYDEMRFGQKDMVEVWEMITNKDHRLNCDNKMLVHGIRQGIPRGKRGEVWHYLAEQYCAKLPPIDLNKYPNYNVPYESLLKQLTSHQHAILIDLGRTFPSHSYFSSPLGPGQLALFNLLKAYSLLDPEVGYCQGLSFVAGVLLLHMEESQAFFLLRHLMFRRGLRNQYLPDMVGLQVKLYQLSRLLHDQLPDLYKHFDEYEVAPTLYAAPWMLTLFASQFPLGFVTRVFDLIFLENTDVVFRVALALLSYHKDKIMACESFEEIMNYIKGTLPAIDKLTLDKIMKQVYHLDIGKQLNEYIVEYQVLQEEMASVQQQVENLHKLELLNKRLNEQNKTLMSQLELALSNVQRLEKTRSIQQSNINKLEMQNRSLDVTIATLATFIHDLTETRKDIEVPGEVRRIVSQFNFTEQQLQLQLQLRQDKEKEREKKSSSNSSNFMAMFKNNKVMVKSLSTGKIGVGVGGINEEQQNLNFKSNSLNPKDLKNSSSSSFFANTHNHIFQQQQQLQKQKLGGSSPLSGSSSSIIMSYHHQPSVIDEDNEENVVNNNSTNDNSSIQVQDKLSSPTNSEDSGIDSPNSLSTTDSSHPLSNCGVVEFTKFNGTRQLTKKEIVKKNSSRNLSQISSSSSSNLNANNNNCNNANNSNINSNNNSSTVIIDSLINP